MKKELQKEFEALVRGHIEKFYANAFTVEGNREDAEYLTEATLVWAAGKFSGLANKARVIDLIFERIGEGGICNYSPTDTDALLSRAMKKIEARGKLKMMVLGIFALVLTAAVLAVAIPQIPFDEMMPTEATTTRAETDEKGNVIQPVIGEVAMEKTQTIEGDNGTLTLENYHNLSKACGVKTVLEDGLSPGGNKAERYCDAISAPDGTAYVVFTDIVVNTESANNQFTLYRMEKDGWKAVGEGEAASYYGENIHFASYDASCIYMTTDTDSNIYVFVLLDGCVTVYQYDCKTGEFTKSDAALPCMGPMLHYTFSIDYDSTVGEKGAIYVGFAEKYKIGFAYYDIAEDTFVEVARVLGKVDETKRLFRVKDGVIHMLTRNSSYWYYRIEADGTMSKKILLEQDGGKLWIFNGSVGCGGMVIDENGACHIVITGSEDEELYVCRYKIYEDGTVEKEILSKLYYQDSSDYKANCVGVLTDDSGNIYYAELYHLYGTANNVFSIGKLTNHVGDAPVCIDVFEIPNHISYDFGRYIKNNTVVFFSSNDIYYFTVKGLGE
ncbi:MAG: hypothetical protein IJ489_11175 [Clostridia bacterium]|nr:hypothetical protein [Clostridia bacterium]